MAGLLSFFLFVGCLTFSCMYSPINCIYTDDIDKKDWYIQLIGETTQAHWDPTGEIVYTTAENGIVAALNATNGGVLWRHEFDVSDNFVRSELSEKGVLCVLYYSTSMCVNRLYVLDSYEGVLMNMFEGVSVDFSMYYSSVKDLKGESRVNAQRETSVCVWDGENGDLSLHSYVVYKDPHTDLISRSIDTLWTTQPLSSYSTHDTMIMPSNKYISHISLLSHKSHANSPIVVFINKEDGHLTHSHSLNAEDLQLSLTLFPGTHTSESKPTSQDGVCGDNGCKLNVCGEGICTYNGGCVGVCKDSECNSSNNVCKGMFVKSVSSLGYLGVDESGNVGVYVISVGDEVGKASLEEYNFDSACVRVLSKHFTSPHFAFFDVSKQKTVILSTHYHLTSTSHKFALLVKEMKGMWTVGTQYVVDGPNYTPSFYDFIAAKITHTQKDIQNTESTKDSENLQVMRHNFARKITDTLVNTTSDVHTHIRWISAKSNTQKLTHFLFNDEYNSLTMYSNTDRIWNREESLSHIENALFHDVHTHNTPSKQLSHMNAKDLFIDQPSISTLKNMLDSFQNSIFMNLQQKFYMLKNNVKSFEDLFHFLFEQHTPTVVPNLLPTNYNNYTTSELVDLLSIGSIQRQALILPEISESLQKKTAHSVSWQTLIFVTTKHKTIIALHAATGLIIWKKTIGNDCIKPQCDVNWVSSHILGDSWASELLIVYTKTYKGGVHTHFEWISPTFGHTTHHTHIPHNITHIIPINPSNVEKIIHTQNHFLVCAIDHTHHPHLLSHTHTQMSDLSSEEEIKLITRSYFFEGNMSTHTLCGFKLNNICTNNTPLCTQTIWQISFANVNESIITYTRPLHRDMSTSPFQVVGDVSVLYRYLNPNLLYVVTQTNEKQLVSMRYSTSKYEYLFTLYAIDLITGKIISTDMLPIGASPPITMTAAEHFIVLHFWNKNYLRYEIRSIELFDTQKDKGPLDIISSSLHGVKSQNISSFDIKPPILYGSTHIFPFAVHTMGVTSTRQGITPKQILMGLESYKLYSIPRQVINVRNSYTPHKLDQKPPKLSAEDQLEGLLPYTHTLPHSEYNILSYNRKITRINNIFTHPSLYESTSFIFASGLDLFFTISHPAKSFDTLDPDFDPTLVITSLILGFIGVIYTHYFKKKSNTNN